MIKSITLELRPRLQVCNAFIHLSKKVNLTEIKIKLSKESIEITIENNTVTFFNKICKTNTRFIINFKHNKELDLFSSSNCT